MKKTMGYLVLARKWRPRTFADVVGQEPITRILVNAIRQGRIPHAYLFSGPRGVGKTTTARILARAINCAEGPTPEPCGVCASCTAIADGSSVDVIEIDGASNNSVDDIRDLREKVKYAPSGGKYKVYIIDEVHMLSASAFNALLKTLEEPPAHVIFVLATTEMKKIPATVLSRCQHMPFRRISASVIKARLLQISETEGIVITPHALGLIARAADGSMRDSLTILDQLFSFSAEVSEETVQSLLGITDTSLLASVSRHLLLGDRRELLLTVTSLADAGTDFRSFLKELTQFFRDLFIASVMKDPADILELNSEEMESVRSLLKDASEDQLTLMLQELTRAEGDVRNASSPQLALEMALMRTSFLSTMQPIKEAVAQLEQYRGGGSARVQDVQCDHPPLTGRGSAAQTQTTGARAESAMKPAAAESSKAAPESSEAPDKGEEPPRRTSGTRDCWDRTMARLDPRLASKFGHAAVKAAGDELVLTLNGGHAVFAEDIAKNLDEVRRILADEAGRPITVTVATAEKKPARKKDLKEKVLKEPMVRDAMELFEGRIVEITPIENSAYGGDDVEENAR